MKNFKISSLFILFALLVTFFQSCQKDSVTLRLRIAGFGNDGKVYIDNSTPRWQENDEVRVNDVDCIISTGNTVTINDLSGNYRAVYPANIVVSRNNEEFTLTIPQFQIYRTAGDDGPQIVEAPMAANSNRSTGSNATSLVFKNAGALLAITVDNTQSNVFHHGDIYVDKITVRSSGAPLWGTATLSITGETSAATGSYNPVYTINANQSGNTAVVLTRLVNDNHASLNVPVPSGGSHVFYVYVPEIPASYSNAFTIEVETHNSDGDGTYIRSQSAGGLGNIRCNEKANITFSLKDASETWRAGVPGIVRGGEFTVAGGPPARKVYFSNGNLQYQASTRTWRFAENQYDYIGRLNTGTDDGPGGVGSLWSNASTSISANYSGWMDLFGWGTSGQSGAAYPYESSTDFSDYPRLATSSNTLYEASGSIYDWGSNAITIGDNTYTGWRTLSKDEWEYLLGTRTVPVSATTRHASWQDVNVNIGDNITVKGLLIYHDNYTGGRHSQGATIEAIPEGCVFLPAAGLRNNTEENGINNSGTYLYYWTSTQRYYTGKTQAYSLTKSEVNYATPTSFCQSTQNICYGYSVRLVKNMPNN